MELFKNETDRIILFLQRKVSMDKGIMETTLNTHYGNKLNQNQFTSILKKIKNSEFKLNSTEGNNTYLNINIRDNSIGLKIYGDKNISKYCETNNIDDIIESVEISDTIKGRDSRLFINNYNLQLELTDEKNITRKSARGAKVISELFKYDKYFKYVKTYSFISQDELFQINFNISKSSNSEEFISKGGIMVKNEVKFNKKKYVKKPKEEERTFSAWWNSLKADANVELSDEKYMKKVSFKSLDNSGTLENELEYEVTVRFIGKDIKGKNKREKTDIMLKSYLGLMEKLLKILQQSDYLISEYEIRQLKGKYKGLSKQYNFRQSFPFSKTLETKNIIRLPYEEYENNVNIRKNYCVTEKADGERNLLFIDDVGNVYLINRQELVRKTGIVMKNFPNTILDGEYVTKLKGNYDIKLFLVFDLYFLNGVDLRERIFMRTDKKNEDIQKSRLETFEDMLKEMEPNDKMEIRKKDFLYGDNSIPSDSGKKRIEQYETELDNLDKNNEDYVLQKMDLENKIEKELKDTKIFKCCDEILDRIRNEDYEYDTDGIIFTPVNLTVGEEPEINKRNKYGGRWGRSFKWKSSKENSIDFQVEFSKDPNGEYIDKVFMDDTNKYRKIYLKVAYDKRNMLVNKAKIVNENPKYLEGYVSILFEPTTNFVPRTFECFLKITNNGGLVCESNGTNVGDVIKDGDIIEFYYDYTQGTINKEHRFSWIPMRKRASVVPNSFETANNIWNTIFEPIKEESIRTGKNLMESAGEYYSSDRKEKNIFKNFHNLLKKSLINSVVTPGATLLDMGTGECGDLHKWLGTDLSSVVGIEYNNYNINNNVNGGFKRIIQAMNNEKYANKELVKNIFLIWGDGSKNILDGSCGMDKLNKFYLDVLMGNPLDREMRYLLKNPKLKDNIGKFKGGFNIVSCQFCMHYFFKNKGTLKGFLININQNLMTGGKFIATCFDGREIFKILDTKQEIEQRNDEGKVIWKIAKKYKAKVLPNDESSLGMSIGVYVNTFNKMEEEYLMNVDYLEKILPEFGLELESCIPFEKHYNEFRANGTLEEELSKESSKFSFLNMTLNIIKKSQYEPMKGGAVDVERFLSNKDLMETTENGDYGLKVLDDDDDDDDFGEEEEEKQTLNIGKMNILDLNDEIEGPLTKGNIKLDIQELIGGNKELNEEINLEQDLSSDLSTELSSDLSEVNLDTPKELNLEASNDVELNFDTLNEVNLDTPKEVNLDTPKEVNLDTPKEVNFDTLNEVNLNEVNMKGGGIVPRGFINEDNINMSEIEPVDIVSPNVKVIKINADQGTLNMINK